MATTAATRATLASERAASAKRALEDALAYALEQGCEVEWTDTREELDGEDLLAPLPLGYSVGEQWQYGSGLDAILPPDLRDRDPLPGTPLALARRGFARNTPTYRWVVTRHLVLSEPMAAAAPIAGDGPAHGRGGARMRPAPACGSSSRCGGWL
jgi:hypothetical protein